MLEISTFISKNLLSITTANIVGNVENVYFSRMMKNLAYFAVRMQDGSLQFLPFESVISFDSALTIKDVSMLKQDVDTSSLISPLQMPVYMPNGNLKGNVEKIEIYKNGVVSKVCTSTFQFAPASISNIGNVILLKSTPRSKGQATNTKINAEGKSATVAMQKTQSSPHQNTTSSLSLSATPMAITFGNQEPKMSLSAFQALVGKDIRLDDGDTHTPTRIICNYDFLLGRTLEKDLTTYTNDVIATKGTVVTPQVLQRARRAGKLVDLTIYSKGEK